MIGIVGASVRPFCLPGGDRGAARPRVTRRKRLHAGLFDALLALRSSNAARPTSSPADFLLDAYAKGLFMAVGGCGRRSPETCTADGAPGVPMAAASDQVDSHEVEKGNESPGDSSNRPRIQALVRLAARLP